MAERQRLDRLIVELGHAPSRARAGDVIRRGGVSVDGVTVTKPGASVSQAAEIRYADDADGYVSRAALKLIAGLDAFGFDATDRIALDLGASTGGFTQVLLERGARHVYAVDVGHGQFHDSLTGDRRVDLREGVNCRDLKTEDFTDRPNAIVSDVSFISLKLALPAALAIARPGAWGVFLVKPQFEVGRERIGKGGIVRDPDDGIAVLKDMSAWLNGRDGWTVVGDAPSPIAGGDGNKEFLLGCVRDGA